MKRIAFLIDGFNIYHALKDKPEYHKYLWLDFSKLVSLFISTKEQIESIYYFTSLATWKPQSVARHRTFISALKTKGINIVYGEFKRKDRYCPLCNNQYVSHEEKQTDVNIAIHLFKLATSDSFDKAIILSADSDLIPAINAFKSTYPNKTVSLLIPPSRNADQLKVTCDGYSTIRKEHLNQCILPTEIDIGGGNKLVRPPTWI